MYQHDTELTEKFARENPAVMAGALDKISFHVEVIRYRCPRCGMRFSISKDSYTGRNIAAGARVSCGDCALHRGGNCRLVLISSTSSE